MNRRIRTDRAIDVVFKTPSDSVEKGSPITYRKIVKTMEETGFTAYLASSNIINSAGASLDLFTALTRCIGEDRKTAEEHLIKKNLVNANPEFLYFITENNYFSMIDVREEFFFPLNLLQIHKQMKDHQRLEKKQSSPLSKALADLSVKKFQSDAEFQKSLTFAQIQDNLNGYREKSLTSVLAINPYISERAMLNFAFNDCKEVRQSLALNSSISTRVLQYLAVDEDRNIRFLVAKHKNTDEETLLKLLQDDDSLVRRWAASHSSLRVDEIEELDNWDDDVARGLVMRDDISMGFVERLWNDCGVSVKFNIAFASPLPEVLQDLYKMMFCSDDSLMDSTAVFSYLPEKQSEKTIVFNPLSFA